MCEPREVHMGQDDEVGTGADRVIDGTASLERLATGASWSEGPVWLPKARRVRWSDIPGDRILEYSLDTGTLSVYGTDVGFTNGRTLDLEGRVVQCSHGHRRIERDVAGTVTEVVASYGGVRLNSPNDVVVALDGASGSRTRLRDHLPARGVSRHRGVRRQVRVPA